ncbi:MAG TPA: zinc ribbon domain-containing protein [Saprospiraceae bacterium]|nr:zinc ribbon domain-containing protein [Saprospiraceae bacterium]
MKKCHVCRTTLPDNARFCFNCGAAQRMAQTTTAPPRLNLRDNVEQQIETQFFLVFRERIETEHSAALLERYSNRLYQSNFQEVINRRAEQLAAQLHVLDQAEELGQRRAERILENAIEDLLDYFIIRHCADLNAVLLPEAILSYQGLPWEDVNLFQMVMHYLDFAHEQETLYTNFLEMPVEKLRNASQAFLYPEPQERIFFICDQSILGSVREGFAMTERAIYWKAHLEKPRQVAYDNLLTLERKKDWITINEHFFSVNQALNLKMFKLLKKIKRLISYE